MRGPSEIRFILTGALFVRLEPSRALPTTGAYISNRGHDFFIEISSAHDLHNSSSLFTFFSNWLHISSPKISQQVEASICRAERVVGSSPFTASLLALVVSPPNHRGWLTNKGMKMATLQIFTAGEILFFIAAAGLYLWSSK